MKNRRLQQIQNTLKKLHNLEIDFANSSDRDLQEAYEAAVAEKDRIISESQFNNYHRSAEYTQNILIMEAIRIYLREIAPKRIRRRKVAESVAPIVQKPQVKESRGMKNTKKDLLEKKLVLLKKMIALKEQQKKAILKDFEVEYEVVNSKNKVTGTKTKTFSARNQTEARDLAAHTDGVGKIKSVEEVVPKKEKSKVKESLSMLLENDLEQAEVILAAKDLSSELQKMIEKVAAMQVQELMPLVDRIRDVFDTEKASAFDGAVKEKLQSAIDTVKQAKDGIDTEVTRLEGNYEGDMESDMATDGGDEITGGGDDVASDADISMDDVEAAPADGAEDPGMSSDDLGGDDQEGVDLGDMDEFGGADAASGPAEEPIGRAKKESVQNTKRVLEARKAANLKKKASSVKLKIDESFGYPPEVVTAFDDLEYCVKRRKNSIEEARRVALSRFTKLRESMTDDVMISGKKMEEALDAYISRNKERLRRVVSLNGLVMPKELKEAVNAAGLTEADFQSTLLEFFEESKAKFADEARYKAFVAKLAEQTSAKPKLVAAWVARMIEQKTTKDVAGESYGSFIGRVLDAKRNLNENIKLTESEKDVLVISKLHDVVIARGFGKWYEDNGISGVGKLMETIAKLEGDTKVSVLSILKKVKSVIGEHADRHGQLDEFAHDKLEQLNSAYRSVRNDFEHELSVHLARKPVNEGKKTKEEKEDAINQRVAKKDSEFISKQKQMSDDLEHRLKQRKTKAEIDSEEEMKKKQDDLNDRVAKKDSEFISKQKQMSDDLAHRTKQRKTKAEIDSEEEMKKKQDDLNDRVAKKDKDHNDKQRKMWNNLKR